MIAACPLRVSWVSGAFGYGDELAYFRQVFDEMRRRIPGTAIFVREGFPVERYPELPLRPELRFWRRARDRRVGDFVYTGNIRVPTPRALFRLARHRADVMIVVEFTPTALLTIAVALLLRRRVLQLIESHPRFRGGADNGAVRWTKGFVARRCHAQLASNQATADYLATQLRIPDERVHVGPYLTSDPGGALPARDDGGPVRFLFLNSLQERKGLHLLMEALAEASGDGQREWSLDVVGDGPARASLAERAERLGIASRVVFHGSVSHGDVGSHYERSHVVICPTQGDYRSLAAFESVNARRPVVLSVHDGAAEEIVAAGAAATVIDPLDADAFAAALSRFLHQDDYLASQMELAAEPPSAFSLRSVGENLEQAVRLAAGRR
ncbi:glycosyltransferase [Microbacterium sp. NPDC089987]|uniref:glycosyltransferase n=1 Tax=Microbacterium sp. NPDC089987 TaxID=3364202 RepID=UPI003821DDD2